METINAVLAADLPDDPPWQDVQVREYLAETVPGERRISWVAEDDRLPEGESEIFAHISMLLLGDIGVGSTTVAAVLVGALCGTDAAAVTGRGSGIDDRTWMVKCAAIRAEYCATSLMAHSGLVK